MNVDEVDRGLRGGVDVQGGGGNREPDRIGDPEWPPKLEVQSPARGEGRRKAEPPSYPSRVLHVPVGGKILPFFSVLVRGREPGPGGGHPSVGYVQGIYVVIALGWVIETVSFGYLGWSYSAAIANVWLRLAASVVVGGSLSTTLLFLVLLFVRKPLPRPQFTSAWKIFAPAALGVVALVAGMGIGLELGPALLVGVLIGGGFAVAGLVYGWMESVFVVSRIVIMCVVAFVVAAPLHEMLFMETVEAVYYEGQIAGVERELDDLDGRARQECEDKYQYSSVKEQGCSDEEREHNVDVLTVEVIEHLLLATRWGAARDSGRLDEVQEDLVDRAEKLGAKDAATRLRRGPESYRGRAQRKMLRSDRAVYGAREESSLVRQQKCRDTVSEIDLTVSRCVEERRGTAGYVRERERLESQLAEYRNPSSSIPPIEVGLAMRKIEKGGGELSEEEEVEARRTVAMRKSATPWFLALLVPLIVITLKLTAGPDLEDYLHRRWGRVPR